MLDAILSFACDLERGVERTLIRPALLTGDSQAHTFRLTVKRGGGDADITGASVAAYFVRADGVTVPITGSVEGSVALVTLPEGCYRVPGRFQLVVKLALDGAVSAVFWGDGAVAASDTDAILDEEGVIPSLDEVLAQVAAAEAAAASANSAAASATTAASSAQTAAARADAAALSIESLGADAETLSPGSAATASWTTVDGAKVLMIGVPQGIQGPQGPKGEPGKDGSGSVSSVNGVASVGGNVTLAASDVGALPADGTAADANMLGGKAPEYYLPAQNLLDNSDFRNPVNQRGASSYTGSVYTIDRWKAYHAETIVNVTDDGIAVSENRLYQIIPPNIIDTTKTYTLAAMKSDGTLDICCAKFDDGADATYATALYTSNGQYLVRLNMGAWVWAALYEGSYTADTLPPYVPKGYAAELAECQRYYQYIETQVPNTALTANTRAYYVPFVTKMRTVPTVTIDMAIERDNWTQTGAEISINSTSSYGCRIYGQVSATASSAFWLDVKLHASADL